MRFSLSRPSQAALGLLTLAATAAAQGSNDCATAQLIAGTGNFAVNTTAATDSPQQGSGCVVAHRDVWFRWVAPTTDSYILQTCGSVGGVDTVVQIYLAAGCPTAGQVIACNDDSCGLQSSASFSATSGNTYMLQLGAFSASSYTGTFNLNTYVPPPPCGPNPGPDVIVGELLDVQNVAAVGGIDAVALGTESCNMGSALLNWIANTPAHPVIRQNVYKYKVVGGAGRFEQVGLSWLKNAFSSLQLNACCTCQPGGDGSHLGIGCSDPYGASLNGSQPNAEPNHLVNAHTGVFTYPPPNPAFAGELARRCQMQTSELEATGGAGAARFYGECHYVTADDAAAGNGNNNASWREMTVTGAGDFNFNFTGSTHRQESAIHVWAALEGGVTLTDVQIPGDGLIVVGSNATSLGGGQYHYEFALYNMNSDRNVGSFAVPVPAGVTVTNIGFHDVNYHSGDGNGYVTFTGTDWTGTHAGGLVTWATQTQGTNNNANALRWGSLYNFRFDANAAPVNGVTTLGLWKSGSPPTVSGAAEVPGSNAFSNFCAGDGVGGFCPCANHGNLGNGCANSAFPGGSTLLGSGNASVAADTAVLTAGSMTGATCVFFQGSAQMAPVVVDDGLGCVTGSVVRLGTKSVVSNASSYPQGGDLSLSVRGAIPPGGGTYYYQCFYRNAVASFCPPATSNRTNGVVVTWAP